MIAVQIVNKSNIISPQQADIKNLTKNTCRKFSVKSADIEIAIVDNNEIKELNQHYLNHNDITDTLSFDLTEKGQEKTFQIVVNGELARQEAEKRGHCEHAELALYIIHGLLHNLGFDDQNPEDTGKMHKAEDEILKEHGYGSVYN